MAAIVTPLRLDRVQLALVSILDEACNPLGAHWGYTEPTREQLPEGYVTLTMADGPGPFHRQGKRGTELTPIDTVTIVVDSVEVGKRYGIELNGFNYFTDGVGGDTVDTIRDRLVAAIVADTEETASAAAGGAGEVDLSANFLGGIRWLSIYGALSSTNLVRAADSVLVVDGTQTMLVNIQAYHKQREPRNGAWALIQQCVAALQSEDLVERLRRYGVGVWDKAQPLDLSAIAGGHWESRASMDVTLAARASWVRPVSTIETVEATITAKDESGSPVATSTLSVDAP